MTREMISNAISDAERFGTATLGTYTLTASRGTHFAGYQSRYPLRSRVTYVATENGATIIQHTARYRFFDSLRRRFNV